MPENSVPPLPGFDPVDLGKHLRQQRETKVHEQPFVTFLVGAGFSRSAGIPLAGEIVAELEKEKAADPLFRKAAEAPRKENVSTYAHLMEALGTPQERARRIRSYVDRARNADGRLKINWSHLLLAAMVRHNYVNRILTTNFDPLVVEALALTGQPIRTFDLNTTGHYDPDILESGAVIYLHGQMHSLLLANTESETQRVQQHYRVVLQEAIRGSYLVVVGYSGDCDPVLRALNELTTFHCGLWWAHYSRINPAAPGPDVRAIFSHHAGNCHLATGDNADLFMRKLVLEGMGLPRPDEITAPFAALERSLQRIAPPLPPLSVDGSSAPDSDPVASALALVRWAKEASEPTTTPAQKGPTQAAPTGQDNLSDLQLKVRLDDDALAGDWRTFDKIARTISPDPSSPISCAVGDGLVRRSSSAITAGDLASALQCLDRAQQYGLSAEMAPWLPTLTGVALAAQAKLKGNAPEADRLFTDAAAKFAEAVRLKHDMHEAFNNWGNALAAQAKLKGNTPEAGRLFAAAAAKYAEAVRLKHDKYDALYNWGNVFADQARLKGNTSEADRLFADAAAKYAEAVHLKPDKHEAFNNWGAALADQAKFKGNTPEADRLFADAAAKFAEAVRLKPELHEAFNNWGVALAAQANLKSNTPEADRLFVEAKAKYAEAIRIKPDKHQAWFNLACVSALQGKIPACLEALVSWKKHDPDASRQKLDGDSDFDRVRDKPAFRAFRDTLPE